MAAAAVRSGDAVAVPQFQTAERRPTVLETQLVDEHLRRGDDPLQISRTDVAHLADPPAGAWLVRVEDPVFGTSVGPLAVRIAYTHSPNNDNNYSRFNERSASRTR